jgi:PadR family transcriptional regulator, regulatory protein PadR
MASQPVVDIQAFAKGLHEMLVLRAIQQGPRHGYQIALDVEQQTDGMFVLQHGTLYPILHRLESEKLITGKWDVAAGRRRRLYRLTTAGRKRLAAESAQARRVLDCVVSYAGTVEDAVSDVS